MTKKTDKKVDAPKAKAAARTDKKQLTTVLDAPVEDPRRQDRDDDPARRERRGDRADPNADPRQRKDTVYDVATRARWGGTTPISDLNADAAEAEASAAETRE